MYIENFGFNNKKDILIMDNIGEIIRGHIEYDFISKKSAFTHYEFSQINQGGNRLLKYTFFYKDFTRVFLVDDYHIVEIIDNKIKHDEILNASYNLFMCKHMDKQSDNNSYFDNLSSNLNDKELKAFDKTLQMHADLVDLYEYYERKNTLGE